MSDLVLQLPSTAHLAEHKLNTKARQGEVTQYQSEADEGLGLIIACSKKEFKHPDSL